MFKKIFSLLFVLLLSISFSLAQEATPESTPELEWETLVSQTDVQLSYPSNWFAISDTDGVTILQDAEEIPDSNYLLFLIEPLYFQTESLLEAMTFGLNNVDAPFDLEEEIPYEELDLEGREAIVVFWEEERANRAMMTLRFTDGTVGLIDIHSLSFMDELSDDIIAIAASFDNADFDPDANPDELANTFEFANGVSFMYPANMVTQEVQEGVVFLERPSLQLIMSTSPFIQVGGTVALQALLQHGLDIAQVPVEGFDYEYQVLDFGERIAIAYQYDRDHTTDGIVIAIRMGDGTIGLVDVVLGKGQLEANADVIVAIVATFNSDPDDALDELFTLEEEETLNANWREEQATEATGD